MIVARGQGAHDDRNAYDYETGSSAGGDLEHWTANSQFQQISPLGELRGQYISSCTGEPANYNKVTHECRVDQTDARLDVLSTRYTVRRGARARRPEEVLLEKPRAERARVVLLPPSRPPRCARTRT